MITNFIRKFKKLLIIIVDKRLRKNIFFNVFPTIEHIPMLKKIKAEGLGTVIDIGANRGQFAILINAYYPRTKLICFEPLSTPFISLKKKLSSNKNVILYNSAIGNLEKSLLMNVSKKDDSSSILKIGKKQLENFPNTQMIKKETINVNKLNFFIKNKIKKPALIKIDVQGYELEVLKGCSDLLKEIKYLYVECSFVELYEEQALIRHIIDYVNDFSFQLDGVYNLALNSNGNPIQADFLFENKDIGT